MNMLHPLIVLKFKKVANCSLEDGCVTTYSLAEGCVTYLYSIAYCLVTNL